MNVELQASVGQTSKATLGMPLTALLLLSISACMTFLLAMIPGLLPPRSPIFSLVGAIGIIGGSIAVFAVPVAVVRISQTENLRTAPNIALTGAAAVPAIAFFSVYLMVIRSATHVV